MENIGNKVALGMQNVLSSREHQNLFKKANAQTCCNSDCKCDEDSCSCLKEEKTCLTNCSSCCAKKEAFENIYLRLVRLSEVFDENGFEKHASVLLKVAEKFAAFQTKEELKKETRKILLQIAENAEGKDKGAVIDLFHEIKEGNLFAIPEKLPFLAKKYKVEIPERFGYAARQILEDSNDIRMEDLKEGAEWEGPKNSLLKELQELEQDPVYTGPKEFQEPGLEEDRLFQSLQEDNSFPVTQRGGFDRFLEGEEDELNADDCGDIRLPDADLSKKTKDAENDLLTFLGPDSGDEDIDIESMSPEEFDNWLNDEEPSTVQNPKTKTLRSNENDLTDIRSTEPATIDEFDFPSRGTLYNDVMIPNSLNKNLKGDTLPSPTWQTTALSLDKYFFKNAKELAFETKDWLSKISRIVISNPGNKFSDKQINLFKSLAKSAKSGDAKSSTIKKLIAFCKQHGMKIPEHVSSLVKEASKNYKNVAFDDLDGFENNEEDNFDLKSEDDWDKEKQSKVKKIMTKILDKNPWIETSTELAEETARELGEDEEGGPLDDDTHSIWDIAIEVMEKKDNVNDEDDQEFEEDEDEDELFD